MTKRRAALVGVIVVSILILILLLVLVFHALRTYFIKRATEEYIPPLVTVSTTKTIRENWQP
ncbi:hypothetical protein B1F79_00355 [Coxiella-like endosymbiont of Rhipicephalus sanguineus]|uniref:hypothetical protein n=1 Tax=Coxiella-like endosymbiont of Rhipicephalus sanguineus TaxID=1955402 RepID=UPI00203D25F1|nr:hypothetical protein [Coxiella-like endosymbiont of Rhipicephalus sanguineus]MBT8506234.1 hypothetical protein [Coxiella-like endosymbiont of Rhipicephalus sanguineus]